MLTIKIVKEIEKNLIKGDNDDNNRYYIKAIALGLLGLLKLKINKK